MAPNLKETPQQRSKRNWFLACFGIVPRKTTSTSDKKSKKSRDRKRLFKLCMPKIKVVIIRRRKGSYDAKTVALKACQSMITLEATKFHQRKINHASITQEPKDQQKVSDDALDLQRPMMDQLDATSCQKKEPIPTDNKCIDNKVTEDSLIGVSIVVVTLIIMSIWGRLCAILCMSAWLYCASLLRMHMGGKPNLASFKIDMASKLYKKKMLKAS